MSIIEKARLFALAAHSATGQVRKYSGTPYWKHCAAVAETVASVYCTEEMIAAAWLHDVVEDTHIPLALIHEEFGFEIAGMVEQLTDVSKPEDGNRASRKSKDLVHTAQAGPMAKTIKLADLIDNTASIVEGDPEFARVYLREKASLLEVLRDGNAILWFAAKNMLEVSAAKIGLELPVIQ